MEGDNGYMRSSGDNGFLRSGDNQFLRGWGGGYFEQSMKGGGHLGLHLRSPVTDRDTKPFLSARNPAAVVATSNGGYHQHRDYGVSESHIPMEFVRDGGWLNQSQRDKYLSGLPGNPNFTVISETSGSHPLQMLQQPDLSKEERMVKVEEGANKGNGPLKKRPGGRAQKSPKPKKSKRVVKDESNSSVQRSKPMKRSMGVVINGIDLDLSGIPIPVCSCTGTPQQCYRWGCGGWQSACCTTSISMYPLPMSNKRRGARIAGRKMSQGAFKKVLEKLATEGYNLSNPIDLRTHWAKHGTNKFVTIR
ncbi:GAGA-binding transcriptional activator [Macleaya cordata]|uniref:GAGA-binding transcriptional activator n=1 Tax=Macleaya cordata TaxID=56857 RepID=A0A200PSG5_MACCD|nr:GAGA-binding transcriptional activator [Macleaya cordata]